ncbi:MAG: hypothetical protein AAF713_17035 [Pseudomonadota bacterium]
MRRLLEARIEVTVCFRLNFPETELRLQIPARVYCMILQEDGDRDTAHLSADWSAHWPKEDNDDVARGWRWAGSFAESTSQT